MQLSLKCWSSQLWLESNWSVPQQWPTLTIKEAPEFGAAEKEADLILTWVVLPWLPSPTHSWEIGRFIFSAITSVSREMGFPPQGWIFYHPHSTKTSKTLKSSQCTLWWLHGISSTWTELLLHSFASSYTCSLPFSQSIWSAFHLQYLFHFWFLSDSDVKRTYGYKIWWLYFALDDFRFDVTYL